MENNVLSTTEIIEKTTQHITEKFKLRNSNDIIPFMKNFIIGKTMQYVEEYAKDKSNEEIIAIEDQIISDLFEQLGFTFMNENILYENDIYNLDDVMDYASKVDGIIGQSFGLSALMDEDYDEWEMQLNQAMHIAKVPDEIYVKVKEEVMRYIYAGLEGENYDF